MLEIPERTMQTEKKGNNGTAEIIRRYREARRGLLKRADSLKGKDEPRRRDLMKKAASMEKKNMTTNQVRRAAAVAELNLLIDETQHRGKKNGKK